MPEISRIVFTGDLFRTYAGERSQIENVRWLSRHYSTLLNALTGLPDEIRLAGAEPFENDDLLRSWYGILGSQPCMTSWARHFDDIPSAELVEAVTSDYFGSLVISIEMSPLLQRTMDARGIPWIDVGISPLRFLQDYAISFRTSHHFDGKFPTETVLGALEVEHSVNRVRDTYRGRQVNGLDGALVFFAQTPQDRTLIKDGCFIGAEEAIAGLRKVSGGRRILVKPHPLEPGNPVVGAVVTEFGAEIIDLNTYEILSSDADVSVATLSSSVGRESVVFGKETHIFHPEVQSLAFSGPTSLQHAFSPALWGSLLSSIVDVRHIKVQRWEPNRLRKEIGYYGLDPAVWETEKKATFYDLDEAARIGLTEKAIAERRTLHERWANLASPEAEPWNERASVAASYLANQKAVADFGCGTMSLRKYLEPETRYIPVDVSSRGPDTIVCDLNVDLPPKTDADAVACLGVLEYLFDPQRFMSELAKTYSTCVISYCITDAPETAPNRRAHAWVNDFSREEILDLFKRTGWLVEQTQPVGTFQEIWRLQSSERSPKGVVHWIRSKLTPRR